MGMMWVFEIDGRWAITDDDGDPIEWFDTKEKAEERLAFMQAAAEEME
jgi:hypothetical protein